MPLRVSPVPTRWRPKFQSQSPDRPQILGVSWIQIFSFWFWGATDSKKKFKAGKAQQKFRSTTKTFTTHKKEIQHTKKVSTLKFFNAQQKIHHTKKFQRTTNFNTHTQKKINAQQNISPHKKKLRHTQTNKKFTTK